MKSEENEMEWKPLKSLNFSSSKNSVGRPRKSNEEICQICFMRFKKPCLKIQHEKATKGNCDRITDLKIEEG
jgi:hypothetical protein